MFLVKKKTSNNNFLSSQKKPKKNQKFEQQWKKDQEKQKKKKRIFLFLFVISSFLLIFISFKTFQLIKFLKTPLTQAPGGPKRNKTWDKKSQLNLLFLGLDDKASQTPKINFILISSFSPDEETFKFFPLSTNLYVLVSEDLGYYKAENLYALGSIQDEPASMFLTAQAISQTLGFPFDGYLVMDDKGFDQALKDLGIKKEGKREEQIKAIQQSLKSFKFFLKIPSIKKTLDENLLTNFSPWELFGFGQKIASLQEDEFIFFEAQDDFFAKKLLTDQSEVLLPEKERVDDFLEKNMADRKIKQERITIEVLNGTAKENLAYEAARFISNSGGEVIDLANFKEGQLEKTVIEVYQLGNSYTTERLKEFFDCEVVEIDETSPVRANLRIFIGLDFWERYFGR